MIAVENLFIYWLGRHNLRPGRQISRNLFTDKVTEALGQGVLVALLTLYDLTPQNGQTLSNNSSAISSVKTAKSRNSDVH